MNETTLLSSNNVKNTTNFFNISLVYSKINRSTIKSKVIITFSMKINQLKSEIEIFEKNYNIWI